MEQNKEYNIGDICFYDSNEDKRTIIAHDGWNINLYPTSRYIPIGVVVIPSSHDVYGTGQCAVISLKEMNCTTPDEGSASYQGLYWNQYNVEIPLPKFHTCIVTGTEASPTTDASGATENTYLPSDKFNGTQCPTDSLAFYQSSTSHSPSSPSPYLEDGSRNAVYYQTKSANPNFNCLADFDGKRNTKVLCDLVTAQPNWKTDETITNSYKNGYSPAACCCWRYHTEGTKQGDWYLPAMGELCYMMVRMKTINDTIKSLIKTYGSDIGVSVSNFYYYWSSSECSKTEAWSVYANYGYVFNSYKDLVNYVRAFLRV